MPPLRGALPRLHAARAPNPVFPRPRPRPRPRLKNVEALRSGVLLNQLPSQRQGKETTKAKQRRSITMAAASTSPSSSPFAVDRTPATAPLGQTVSVAPDPATGAKELGRLVKRAAARAISERGSFTLVLSGGSLVDALASSLDGDDGGDDGDDETSPPHDGSKWHAFWADERLVPGDSLDSNAAGARAFIAKAGIPASNVHALADPPAACPHEAAREYEARLRALPREVLPIVKNEEKEEEEKNSKMPLFDLVLLGVGPDGHVASLFPGLPAVDVPASSGQWVVGVEGSPKPPPLRISLTLGAITSAKEILVVAFGAGKGDIIRQALLLGGKAGSVLPVQRVAGARWLIDAAAAAGLEEEEKKE